MAMYVGVGGSSGGTVGAGAHAEALDEGVQAEAVPLRLIGLRNGSDEESAVLLLCVVLVEQ